MDRECLNRARSKVMRNLLTLKPSSQSFTTHYLGRADVDGAINFMKEIFFDEHCSFAFKVNILQKVLTKGAAYLNPKLADKKSDGVHSLTTLANNRNKFAHCGPALEIKRAGSTIKITPHPNKVDQTLDFDEALQSFTTLQPKVLEWLQTVKKDLDAFVAKK